MAVNSVVTNSTGGKILNVTSRLINQPTSSSVASGGDWNPTIPDSANDYFGIVVSPLSATSKILFTGFVMAACPDAGQIHMTLRKDGGDVTEANSQNSGSRRKSHSGGITSANAGCISLPINYLYSPGSTTPFALHIQLSHESGSTRTVYINRTSGDGDNNQYGRYCSVFTAIEFAS
tara:strand:+ start:325 stop:855 length:531 start_codon:yes stop_codon:yes gene_type:complete